jgi:spore coat polysaccharide biosynthesis predicted glycosyltransferase SpsG
LNLRPDIDFIVAGGSRYGMGHVMRSGALAAAAAQRGWRVRVFLAGDRAAGSAWRDAVPSSVIDRWTAWRPSASAPLTLFDHPFAKTRWLAACRRDRTRTIVLDDPRAIGRARLTINPALHHLPPEEDERALDDPEDDPACLVLRGPRYAILSAAHRATPHAPLERRATLLLSLGGADPHAVTPRIAPWLAETLAGSEARHPIRLRRVVLGPAFADPDGRIARELADAGWRVERALEPAAMAARMAEARLAVMGFGTSLGELAWHGTPHLSVTHHTADDAWAERLEARGIGRWLGHAVRLEPEAVKARLAAALGDGAWQAESARRARAVLEGGRGGERILDRLAAIAREVAGARRESGLGHGGPSAPLA